MCRFPLCSPARVLSIVKIYVMTALKAINSVNGVDSWLSLRFIALLHCRSATTHRLWLCITVQIVVFSQTTITNIQPERQVN